MSQFYRFLRPEEYDYKRGEIVNVPHGGICLHVEQLSSLDKVKHLLVSYNICPPTQQFNRNVSKNLAKQAPKYLVFSESVSTDAIIACMLKHAEHHPEFKAEASRILVSMFRAEHDAHYHKDAVKALHLRTRYDELQAD